ncbi:MAG: P1 family peptidase [Albidovulum sp.]|nr:P1 family peptidase [Albidovulum sp.]
MKPGPKNAITDISGLLVGNASDSNLKSGVTVVLCEQPFTAGVHVMGGAPGSRETELLVPDRHVQEVDAIFLSGGSAFGLDSGSGIANALRERGRGFQVGAARVPIVPGAILFDLLNGGDKNWTSNPYSDLGRQALEAASADFSIGTAGAGTGATTLDLKGGLGTASAVIGGGFAVGALAAVNSVGSAIQQGQPNFWAAPFEMNGEFGGLGPAESIDPFAEPRLWPALQDPGANTTIAVIATDAMINQAQATRIAVAAHDGLARSLVPSHTLFDGDIVFAIATGARRLKDSGADILRIGHAAAICLARAVARGVYLADKAAGDTAPTWKVKFAGM